VADYPVQLNKVQAPPLRDDTLARDRLLDWLHTKIHRRVVLVLAEAGYGKTTLLADFTRRSRIRVAWYRLDHGDRDWPGFIAHLVAAVRVHHAGFAPVTASMVRDSGGGMPSRESVIDTFIRELGELPSEPMAIVFDDFHLVDDAIDPRVVVRELLARAPERVSIVLVSRRNPPVPVARLRSLGEVAELRTADLRFMPQETERLFREAFALDLEPSIIAELSRRTEGWVASLQLVRTAIRDRDRSEIRAFVRSLSGAEGDLYDYLAEEVVGELAPEFQQFLMRTSLLEIIDPLLGGVAATTADEPTRELIREGEVLGLFSRTGPNARDQVRAHPLVRDFLQARLLRLVGPAEVIRIHRVIAQAAESMDWRIAGHHFVAAGDRDDARRVLGGAIEVILAEGAYAAAEELVSALPETADPDPNVLVVRSRIAQQRGELLAARELAEAAYLAGPDSVAAALNLQTARLNAGDFEGSLALTGSIEANQSWPQARELARTMRLLLETSTDGSLQQASAVIVDALSKHRSRGESHFVGVGLLNLGYLQKAAALAADALESSEEAIASLSTSSAGIELVSARLLRAWALAHLGDMVEARREMARALSSAPEGQRLEVAYETGEIEVLYGDADRALHLLRECEPKIDPSTDGGAQAALVLGHVLVAIGRPVDALATLEGIRPGVMRTGVAFEARRRLALALAAGIVDGPSGASFARDAHEHAARQGAHLWSRLGRIYEDAAAGALKDIARIEAQRDPALLTMAAEVVARNLSQLDETGRSAVAAQAQARPDRWCRQLRATSANAHSASAAPAATILDLVGSGEDVAFLRRLARTNKALPASIGRGLARRLAARVMVEDLGRVRIGIGDRIVDGSSVRRKVLALLCLLLTKHRYAATRDEVLDALWPDLEPAAALNSLNQTVYFLRRVFEPEFSDDLSPGYIGQDGETVWLDQELVDSRSRRCRELLRQVTGQPDPDLVLEVARQYGGRFALDFAYEEWAAPFRDSLHASYLRAVEGALRSDLDSGQYARGIETAELAASTDPEVEEIQVALMRLYRQSGSRAAAGEQYEHYARTMRDLGLEPQPFEAF
jgi:ATP/maltotriose-dependent transcriptional regulator MalT/DNA-binding SARP family transcriptional activator